MVVGFGKVLCQIGKIIFNMWSLWLVKELMLVSGTTSGVGYILDGFVPYLIHLFFQ
jgi:hypothetical protein